MNATTKEEQNALTLPPAMRAAVVLKSEQTRKELAVLVQKSAGILTVTNPAGRDEAHRAGMTLKNTRVAIEKTGKMAREDATAFSKAVIAEEKSLVDIIAPEENRVLGLRDRFDEAEQARKDALIAAERQRTESIQAAIQAIRDIPISMAGKSSQDISHCIGSLVGTIPDEFYQEFIEQAQAARHEALDKLAAMETAQRGVELEAETKRQEDARIAAEAEEARKAEALRIEQERATLAAQRDENERIANEHAKERQRLADEKAAQEAAAAQLREKAAANLRAEREAQELAMRLEREKLAREQAERDRVAADTKRQLDEQQAQIAAERQAFADEKAAAVQREADRQAAETLRQQIQVDHAEDLEMNAALNAGIARIEAVEKFAYDDLARCNATVGNLLTDARVQASLAAYGDAGLDDPEVTDEEITEQGREWGLDKPALIVRLRKYLADAEVAA